MPFALEKNKQQTFMQRNLKPLFLNGFSELLWFSLRLSPNWKRLEFPHLSLLLHLNIAGGKPFCYFYYCREEIKYRNSHENTRENGTVPRKEEQEESRRHWWVIVWANSEVKEDSYHPCAVDPLTQSWGVVGLEMKRYEVMVIWELIDPNPLGASPTPDYVVWEKTAQPV